MATKISTINNARRLASIAIQQRHVDSYQRQQARMWLTTLRMLKGPVFSKMAQELVSV